MDESKFGMAKTIAMQVINEEVDITDQKAVDALIKRGFLFLTDIFPILQDKVLRSDLLAQLGDSRFTDY